MIRFALAGSALIALSPARAQTTDAFADIPGVTVAYYDVEGRDGPMIRRAIDARRPTDTHDRTRVDAISRWSMRWSLRGSAAGTCDLDSVVITFAATVTMPRLTSPVMLSPALKADWDRYVAALERHEAGHVRYAYDHRDDVRAAIRAGSCATVAAAGKAAIARIAEHDVAYDRETQHGRTQGARFPTRDD